MLSDYDYALPKELIAQRPLEVRDASRLMVLTPREIEHARYRDLENYLVSGDVLVINDSRVLAARLRGRKATGGRVEALVLGEKEGMAECLLRGKNLRAGAVMDFGVAKARIAGSDDGKYFVEFDRPTKEVMAAVGEIPLPHYIKEKLTDRERYQTVYARAPGSIAAPTAGLHFTDSLLERLKRRGVELVPITLHIGAATFAPINAQDLRKHRVEPEYFEVSEGGARAINEAKAERRRVIVVGTTTLKALESAANGTGAVHPTKGWSDLFIHPPQNLNFGADAFLTNFHLPKSSPLLLVCAYAGRERIMNAYELAVREGYRFYSFGDAMLCFGNGKS